jgi:hypothetical protein
LLDAGLNRRQLRDCLEGGQKILAKLSSCLAAYRALGPTGQSSSHPPCVHLETDVGFLCCRTVSQTLCCEYYVPTANPDTVFNTANPDTVFNTANPDTVFNTVNPNTVFSIVNSNTVFNTVNSHQPANNAWKTVR